MDEAQEGGPISGLGRPTREFDRLPGPKSNRKTSGNVGWAYQTNRGSATEKMGIQL